MADPYAIVGTGGKQYLVHAQDTLTVERLAAAPGEKVELRPVLAVSDGKALQIGAPELPDARVTSTVVEHVLGDKVVSFKKKRRKGYARRQGHRQRLTVLRIESIG